MMNALSFSTLSCPDWPLDKIVKAARDYGYQAIELRGLQDEMDLARARPFLPGNRQATRRLVEGEGIQVVCVSSSGVVEQANTEHVRAHCELAADLGCAYVRVFGGGLAEGVPHEEALARAADTLRAFGDAAGDLGVQLVLETHDAFSTGRQVAELLARANHPSVFALWDLHHPFGQGESPNETFQAVGQQVRFVHVKDGGSGGYALMGEGSIPLTQMLDLLLDHGYTGPLSVEWEKRWHPDLAPPEVALPQYARALQAYLAGRACTDTES